jgi:hypothetical protein
MGGRKLKHLDKGIAWDDHLDATFQVYELVRTLRRQGKVSDRIVGTSLGYMLSSSTSSWRVVGITCEALERFRSEDAGFLKRPTGKGRVERGHLHHRRTVIKKILGENFTTPTQLWDYWNKHDDTLLCLSDQNNCVSEDYKGDKIIKGYRFRQPTGADRPFFANAKTSYSFDPRHEGRFLADLWRDIKSGLVRPERLSVQK